MILTFPTVPSIIQINFLIKKNLIIIAICSSGLYSNCLRVSNEKCTKFLKNLETNNKLLVLSISASCLSSKGIVKNSF